MAIKFSILSHIAFLGTGLLIWAAAAAWRRRDAFGAVSFAAFLLSIGWWSLAFGIQVSCTELAAQQFWYKMVYIGVLGSELSFAIFTIEFNNLKQLRNRRVYALLAVQPVVSLLLILTNDLHQFVFLVDENHGLTIPVEFLQPGFYLTRYSLYAVYGSCFAVFIWKFVSLSRHYRRQISVVMFGILLGFSGDLLLAILDERCGTHTTPTGQSCIAASLD